MPPRAVGRRTRAPPGPAGRHLPGAVGIWLENARAAARKTAEIERRHAEGLPAESSAGALSDERREQMEEIDASSVPDGGVESCPAGRAVTGGRASVAS